MIYLIDDNRENQQESYGCSFIKEGIYNKYLTYLDGIPTPDRADFMEEFQEKATLVLFHTTSKDLDRDRQFLEKTETITKIKDSIKTTKPYVGFSWGHTSHIATFLNENIDSINKRIFYLNFKEFIEDYIKSGTHDFNILAKGAAYKKEILIEQGRRLIQELANFSKCEPFICGNNFLTTSLDNFFQSSETKTNIKDFCEQNSSQISYFELVKVIEKSIESIQKYGKNLYY